MRKLLGMSVVIALFFLSDLVVHSATYYVDPSPSNLSARDSNPGTRFLPWRHIPGSYDQLSDTPLSGWRTKIRAGDTIRVKSGTTITNRVKIDSVWYEQGSSGQPIRIQRATDWGSGIVIFDGKGTTIPDWLPMIYVVRDYVEIDGMTERGISIVNSPKLGLVAGDRPGSGPNYTESRKMKGLVIRNLYFFNNAWFNVSLMCQDSFLLENLEVDGNRMNHEGVSGGVMVGDQEGGCTNGIIRNCNSYNHGSRTECQGGGSNTFIGFWLVNSTDITYEGCSAHDNKGDGFDTGVVGEPNPSVITDNIKYVNCISYMNRGDGFGVSLYDLPPAGGRFHYINCISGANYYTASDGSHCGSGWNIYAGADAYLYNCISANNGRNFYVDTPYAFSPLRTTGATLRNTIIYESTDNNFETAYVYKPIVDPQKPRPNWEPSSTLLTRLDLDYNLYDQGDGTNILLDWNNQYSATNPPNPYGSTRYYFTHNGMQMWRQDHPGQDVHSYDSCGDGKKADFADPMNGDFHIGSASGARGSGVNLTAVFQALGVSTSDRDGNPRPDTGSWDMGAYVFGANPFALSPAGLAFSGYEGGSFSAVGGNTFTLRNNSAAAVPWSATKTRNWTSLSTSSGTLRAGESTTVRISINGNAAALDPGTYSDAITFSGISNAGARVSGSVDLTVLSRPAGSLSVTPTTGFTSSGRLRGPFSPPNETYTLANTGSEAINWTASKRQNWTSLSRTSGRLAAGASVAVTVSINGNARYLSRGTYYDTVSFVNVTNSAGNTSRSVTLQVR